jgi:hypothetical protein
MRPTPDHTDQQEVLADRLLQGQLQARRLNEQIGRQHHTSAFGEFVCECGLETCVQAISLTAAEFEEIRKRAHCFAVAFGHVSLTEEIVVEENDRYQVVQRARQRLGAHGANHHRRDDRRVGALADAPARISPRALAGS